LAKRRKFQYNVNFKRPPKTSKEAIDTLQEVDARYEVSKSYLSGEKFNPETSLQDSETKEEMEK
jgi:hypothetical protein